MNYAWAIAFAFVGMCFAIAYATVHAPPQENPKVTCIKMRGAWSQFYQTCTFREHKEVGAGGPS